MTSSTPLTDAKQSRAQADLLEVEDLRITLRARSGVADVVDGVSFSIQTGEAFGLVGESGSGKSMTALAVMRLLPRAATVSGGRVRIAGQDVLAQSEAAMRNLRGAQVGMILQQARSSLNPVMRIGAQISRVLRTHGRATGKGDAASRTGQLLEEVGLPARVAKSYPHQLSGGMAQRALIAIVLAAEPRLLIADEPTTGLDVTTEAEIYDLLARLQKDLDLSLLLISHDLALVAQNCDRVGVMHAGNLIEIGDAAQIFAQPLHPYTQALLASVPGADETPRHALVGQAPRLFELRNQGCRFIERCPHQMPKCAEPFAATEREPGHRVLCRLYD